MNATIIVYTDGACKGNGKTGDTHGKGGFGVCICYADGSSRHIWGGQAPTTNNRMEMMAAIVALQNTPPEKPLQIWTDSAYLQNGINQWLAGWKKRGWKKADGKAVLNVDLWQQLDGLCLGRQIDWRWIKGHAGHKGNEIADQLANKGVDGFGDVVIDHVVNDHVVINQATNNTPTTIQLQSNNHQNKNSSTTQKAVVCDEFTPLLPPPINQNHANRQLIFDTETTGKYPNTDRIVEIGVIELVDRKPTGERLHAYINPQKLMDEEVMGIHGISNEFLADKPTFEELAKPIYDFMKGAQLIAHNAKFDMAFLKAEFDQVGLTDFVDNVKVIDTLELAKQKYPGQKNSLDALVKRLDVGKKDRTFHGALLDCEILTEVYLAMTGGQASLIPHTNTPTIPTQATQATTQTIAKQSLDPLIEQTPLTNIGATASQHQILSSQQNEQNLFDGDTSKKNPYFVPILPPPINQNHPERQLILDTETTGFEDQNGDRIIEIGIVEMVGRRFTGQKLHAYFNPHKKMDQEVINKVHGISNEFLTDKPDFADLARPIYDFMKGAQLIAHNAKFDMAFLKAEFDKVGLTDFLDNVKVIDTLELAKQKYPGQKNSLDALVKRLDVGKKDRTFHGALLDSEILAEVYLAMTGGQVSLVIDQKQQSTHEQSASDNLAQFAHLLVQSPSNQTADLAWREQIFK